MEGESASWTIKINWHSTSPERVYLDVKTDPLLMPWHKITLQPKEIQAVKEGTADLTIQTKPNPTKNLVHEVEEYTILITAKSVYSGVLRSITVTAVVQEAESIEVLVEPQELYLDYGDKSILNEPNPQAKITVIAKKGGKPAKEMEINIKVCTERGGEGTDGHIHDKGRKRCDRDSRPTGELENNDGERGNDLVEKTNENGKIILTYTPPKIHDGNHDHIIAGKDWIIATEQDDPSVEGENWIVTKVPNLQPMPGSELERLCGGEHVPLDSPWFFEKQTRHDCIFYGTEATNDALVRIANEFMQRQMDCAFNPGGNACKIEGSITVSISKKHMVGTKITAMSLPWGGLHDIKGNWKPSHHTHGNGRIVDLGFAWFEDSNLGRKDPPPRPLCDNYSEDLVIAKCKEYDIDRILLLRDIITKDPNFNEFVSNEGGNMKKTFKKTSPHFHVYFKESSVETPEPVLFGENKQADVSVATKHKKKVTLVAVKNNGDEEIFGFQMKINDGKIRKSSQNHDFCRNSINLVQNK